MSIYIILAVISLTKFELPLIIGAAVSTARPAYNKDRCFTLLVIDDQNTDW